MNENNITWWTTFIWLFLICFFLTFQSLPLSTIRHRQCPFLWTRSLEVKLELMEFRVSCFDGVLFAYIVLFWSCFYGCWCLHCCWRCTVSKTLILWIFFFILVSSFCPIVYIVYLFFQIMDHLQTKSWSLTDNWKEGTNTHSSNRDQQVTFWRRRCHPVNLLKHFVFYRKLKAVN